VHQKIERGNPHAERLIGEAGPQEFEGLGVGCRSEGHDLRGHGGRVKSGGKYLGFEGLTHKIGPCEPGNLSLQSGR